MYKIGELSKLCQLPVKTLRYYDSIGLLIPDKTDPFTGYRYYSASRLADCNRIVALKELGFSLEEVRRHLNADEPADVAAMLDAKEAELKEHIKAIEAQLRRLAVIREIITEGDEKMFDIVIKASDSVRVAYVRQIFKSKEEAYSMAEKIGNALSRQTSGSRILLINYETEYRDTDFDLAACAEITSKLPEGCPYEEKELAVSGDIASLVCKKEEVEAAYRFLVKQLADEGVQIVGAFCEYYHTDGTVEIRVPVYRPAGELQDDERLPFVNDAEVLGKWKLLDRVPSEEQFLYGHEKSRHGGWLDELYFLENGEAYWAIDGWTKGYLVIGGGHRHRYNNRYTIKEQNGHTLLFLEMKHYCDGGREKNAAPEIWVYEKADSRIYHVADIRRRDFVDYPFEMDERVVGSWRVRDFYCEDIENHFNPAVQNWATDDLFVKSMTFYGDGSAKRVQKDASISMSWTKGYILEKQWELASAYRIMEIGGVEYLITEWKSGDYVFGSKARIYYYVFVRA